MPLHAFKPGCGDGEAHEMRVGAQTCKHEFISEGYSSVRVRLGVSRAHTTLTLYASSRLDFQVFAISMPALQQQCVGSVGVVSPEQVRLVGEIHCEAKQ